MKTRIRKVVVCLTVMVMMVSLTGCFGNKASNTGQVNNSGNESPETVSSKETVETDSEQSAEEYQEALPIVLKDIEGNTISLEDYKGKFVLINFWATWCKYCDQEMPDLVKLQEKNKDLVILAINVNEDLDTVKAYINKNDLDLKVLMDSEGEVAEAYYVSSMPTSFFVDRNGKVIGYLQGMMSAEDMDKAMSYLRERDTAK